MIHSKRMPAVVPALCVLTGIALCGCEFEAPPEAAVAVETPIINGNTETSWPAVGALVMSYPGYGFTGSFCSGTLIDKRWVLTAAHCATPSADFPIAPGIVSFMFTSDARPLADGSRPAGTLVESDYFIPNESYDGENNDYDIALVHLVRDVTEVDPLPVNTASIYSYSGKNFFFVGFGVDDGANETGGGLKRSAYIPVSDVQSRIFSTDAYNTAVCFGDSGGPALYQINGTWKVVGVNSAVMGYGDDPCVGVGIHVRADAHTTWINNIMNTYPPDCNDESDACLCDDACGTDGTCDFTACETMSCGEVTECVFKCYSASDFDACANPCFIAGNESARERFDNVMGCYATKCYPSSLTWETCMSDKCNDRYNECYFADRDKLDCAGVFSCYNDCIADACRSGCEWLARTDIASDWSAFDTCWHANCADQTGSNLTTCLSDSCPAQTTACFKPDECDPTGGDCPDGYKCRQFMTYTTTCVESQGIAAGETCKVEVNKADPCGDGLVCMMGEGGRKCRQVCAKADGCADGLVCKGQPFPDLADYGWCGCEDLDEDGVCAVDDCDDTRDAVYPGAKEYCEGLDNNCDGTTDEGCTTTCDDADQDGSCDEADCDDEHATVYPGALEVCSDKLDNDCDGDTDEGCESCVDLDKDGYCSDRDCNDRDYRISPNATEVCGDGVDNDCDGQKDEDCSVTTDDVIETDAIVSSDEGGETGSDGSGCSAGASSRASGLALVLLLIPMAAFGLRRRFN